MRKKGKLTVIILVVLAGTIILVSGQSKRQSSSRVSSPRSLYLANCATCHGSNGKAQTARGRKLDAADLTSADVKADSMAKLLRTIRNGRLGMPAFGRTLTPAQISSIANYIRTL